MNDAVLREASESLYQKQLAALKQHDKDTAPSTWQLSPRAVLTYILGGETLVLGKGKNREEIDITPKFFGDRRIVERAIVTLASDRALLLIGDPGTGKSWLSENLAAAICGDSSLTIQGTAGTSEEHIKYTWNIAKVIAEGYREDNLVPSPSMAAMENGKLLRFEEITRCVPDVQDALVSLLSEKAIAIPELPNLRMKMAIPGFNVIATANSRDQGVNEFSAALKRRFNYIHIPVVNDKDTEVRIVLQRLSELQKQYQISLEAPKNIAKLLVTVFRELREGMSEEGVKLQDSTNTLSTAEAISIMLDASLHASYYGDNQIALDNITPNLAGVLAKDDNQELRVLKEYNELVAKKRGDQDALWQAFYISVRNLV